MIAFVDAFFNWGIWVVEGSLIAALILVGLQRYLYVRDEKAKSGGVNDGLGSTANLLPDGADDAPNESKEGQDGPPASPLTTHKPGADGLFATTALCGAFAFDGGVLRMHEWDYDCPVCAHIAGEGRFRGQMHPLTDDERRQIATFRIAEGDVDAYGRTDDLVRLVERLFSERGGVR